MQNQVPSDINRGSRQVVLRHPNSFSCIIMRKQVNRQADTKLGSMPTIGGMGVLSSDDESDVDWNVVGRGKMLFADSYAPSMHDDRSETLNYAEAGYLALIEHEPDDEYPELLTPKKNDIVQLVLLAGASIAYEVTGTQGDVSIPPYTRRYELQKRDDLNYIPGAS